MVLREFFGKTKGPVDNSEGPPLFEDFERILSATPPQLLPPFPSGIGGFVDCGAGNLGLPDSLFRGKNGDCVSGVRHFWG